MGNGPDVNIWKVENPQERYRHKHYKRFTEQWTHDSSTSCQAPILSVYNADKYDVRNGHQGNESITGAMIEENKSPSPITYGILKDTMDGKLSENAIDLVNDIMQETNVARKMLMKIT